jgi:hypothetical protein
MDLSRDRLILELELYLYTVNNSTVPFGAVVTRWERVLLHNVAYRVLRGFISNLVSLSVVGL